MHTLPLIGENIKNPYKCGYCGKHFINIKVIQNQNLPQNLNLEITSVNSTSPRMCAVEVKSEQIKVLLMGVIQ